MSIKRLLYILLTMVVAVTADSCIKDQIDNQGMMYVEGVETYISLRVSVPAMDIATRADMPDGADYAVRSLWVGIFSAKDKRCTYAQYHNTLPKEEHGNFITLDNIKTESGPSYIVAVANPTDNFGYLDKGDGKVTREALDVLLPRSTADAYAMDFTWDSYTNIAIRQLDLNDVNTPIGNLVMSGIYIDSLTDPDNPADWEELCQTPFVIQPYSGVKTLDGAIHLRRLISQVKFHIDGVPYTGSNTDKNGIKLLEIVPQSFQVKNVPYTSWLHERKGPSSVSDTANKVYREANSGDVIKIDGSSFQYDGTDMENKINYRSSVWFNGGQYITGNQTDGYDFDFWMMENKRYASYNLYEGLDRATENDKAYDRREKEVKDSKTIQIPNTDSESGYEEIPYDENLGIYLSLCSSKLYNDPNNAPTIAEVPETMNNCATFVEIRCRIVYTDEGLDAIRNDDDYKEVQYRSADAVYTVHLGGIGQNWNDFTHRRNHKYTYYIKVMDIDRIIVEARYDDEPRPGIEGVVTDVVNPPFEVDCHYAVFNVQLCNLERTGGGIIQTGLEDDPNTGFGTSGDHEINGGKYERGVFPFRIRYFDKDNFARYIDQSNIDEYMDMNNPNKNPLHWQWVEFRPTTGKDVIADYKPYEGEGSDGMTFRINEVADIVKYKHPEDHSTSKVYDGRPDEDDRTLHWYTVFVNEYVYETKLNEGENNFVNYVNLSPRMCWMNTLFRSSIDDESNYIRSKYVVRQQSIQTFYANIPHSTGNDENDFNAIGMEHVNETFGFNLRWDGVPTEFEGEDRTHNMQNNNGRHNTALYVYDPGHETRGELWTDYMNPNRLQFITGINKSSNQYAVSYQLQEAPYIEDTSNPKREPYYVPAIYTFPYRNIQDQTGTTDPVESRSNINTSQYLRILDACMNRNRDNNGNGRIDIDEIRWYVPASSEIVDLVLGHYSLETPLLDYNLNYYLASPGSPQNPSASGSQTEQNHQGNTRFHYATSNQRVLWAEEGATINPEADVLTGTWNLPPQNVRCVRALGTNLETDENKDLTPAFTTNAKYTTDADGHRNYTTYADEIYPTYYEQKNQRSYSSVALEPHQETTGDLNRVCYYGFKFSKELLTFRSVDVDVWVDTKTYPAGWYANGIQDDEHYMGSTEGGVDPEWNKKNPEWRDAGYNKDHRGGAYYKPISSSYAGNDRDNKPTSSDPGTHYEWWDAFTDGGTPQPAGYYLPDETTYSDEPFAGAQWWEGFYSGDYKGAGKYKPDTSTYKEGDKNANPGYGYEWWDAYTDGGVKQQAGWYLPDETTYSAEPFAGAEWWEGFYDGVYKSAGYYQPIESSYAGNNRNNKPEGYYEWWDEFTIGAKECIPGYYWPDLSSGPQTTAPNSDYVYFDDFGDVWYGPSNYAPDLTLGPQPAGTWGSIWFNEINWGSSPYAAGYYIPDVNNKGNAEKQYIGNGFWSGEHHLAGYYARDVNRFICVNDWDLQNNGLTGVSFKKFNTTVWAGGTTKQAGWYKPDPATGPSSNTSAPGYKQCGSFYTGTYHPAGWYLPKKSSRIEDWQKQQEPAYSNDDRYHRFPDGYIEGGVYHPAGWYKPDPSSGPSNSNDPGYKSCGEFYTGTYQPAGWYLPKKGSRTDKWEDYNFDKRFKNLTDGYIEGGEYHPAGWYLPDGSTQKDYSVEPGYKQCSQFYEGYHEAGYYADGIIDEDNYLGSKIPPDPNWANKNPKWLEERVDKFDGEWETRYVSGQYTDAGGGTSNLFAYNEGSFVDNHGTTLAAANKICNEEYGAGWRLPNMKEASLIKIAMDNAGVYKGPVNGQYLTREKYSDPVSGYDVGNFIACTFREYGITGAQSRGEKTGYYTGIYYAEPGEAQAGDWSGDVNNSPVLGRIACITTGWNRHFYIRCVKDLPAGSGGN